MHFGSIVINLAFHKNTVFPVGLLPIDQAIVHFTI